MGRGDPRRRRDSEVTTGGMHWRTRLAAFVVALAVLTAAAPFDRAAAQNVDPYDAVFDGWIKKYNPKTAILVVRRAGTNVFIKGHNFDPRQPTLIASLSKAITGACIATLVRDGKLAYTTQMRDALARFFKLFGRPVDERLEQVTVEELLVHRSGLRGNADDDPIMGVFNKRADVGIGPLGDAQPVLAEYVLKERLARHPGGRYSYSNTGYAMLTAVIEEQTGRLYEDYCREAVFGKLGLPMPVLHPDWRMLSGAGGWFIPAPDYLAFYDIFDPAHPFLDDTTKAWIDRAQKLWTPSNRDRWYSLGVNTWSGQGRWAVSHGGIMHSRGKNVQGRPTEGFIASHVFRSADGTGVFMAIEWTPDATEVLDELREKIGRVHKLVKMPP